MTTTNRLLSMACATLLTLTILLGAPVAFVFAALRSKLVLTAYLLTVLTTIVLYVLACDPLPPCPGKVREWVDNFARSRRIPA